MKLENEINWTKHTTIKSNLVEEKKAIFDELLNFCIWEKDYTAKTKELQRNSNKIKWRNYFFIGFCFLFFLATILLSLIDKIIINNTIARETTVCLFVISFVLFILAFIYSIEESIKSFRNINEEFFYQLRDRSIASDEIVVKLIFYQQETLNSVEQDFEDKLKELQAAKERISSFLPILAFIIVVFPIIIFSLSSESLGKNIIYVAVLGVPGFMALILAGLGFYKELLSRHNISRCNKCISVLKKAQIKIDKSKEHKNLAQIKQHDKKPSLLSRLQNISIEGPEDFAANHDMYISGEKRIEPDIR